MATPFIYLAVIVPTMSILVKSDNARIAHKISSIRAGFSLKKISFSRRSDMPERRTRSAVSSKMKRSKRFSRNHVKINSAIPIIKATIKPTFIPQISSAMMKTRSGMNPGSSFLNNSACFNFRYEYNSAMQYYFRRVLGCFS